MVTGISRHGALVGVLSDLGLYYQYYIPLATETGSDVTSCILWNARRAFHCDLLYSDHWRPGL